MMLNTGKDKGDKLDRRGRVGTLFGYNQNGNNYRIWDRATITDSESVKFFKDEVGTDVIRKRSGRLDVVVMEWRRWK